MFDYLNVLFAQGGAVMPWILLLSVLMWILILERYWFLYLEYPRLFTRVQHEWSMRTEYRSRTARRLRAQKIASLTQDARRDRKSTRLNSSHIQKSRMPSSA